MSVALSTRVSIDVASMVALTCADVGSLPLVVIVPEVFLNCPFHIRDHHMTHG